MEGADAHKFLYQARKGKETEVPLHSPPCLSKRVKDKGGTGQNVGSRKVGERDGYDSVGAGRLTLSQVNVGRNCNNRRGTTSSFKSMVCSS